MSQELVDRCVGVFRFLAAAQQLRCKPVADLSSYEKSGDVVWFHRLPREDAVRWQAPIEVSGPFLEVDRVRAHKSPEPPDELHSSIRGDLSDASAEPTLHFEGDKVEQRDHLEGLFDEWRASWQDWAACEKRDAPIRELYARLFQIHLQSEQKADEMQLVLAVGLLAWQQPSGPRVRRHVLTAEVGSHLDETSGRLTFRVDESVTGLHAELDMLDPSQVQDPSLVTGFTREAIEAGENPFGESVASLSQGFVHRLHSEARYEQTLDEGPAEAVPVVRFAPALIFRPRSQAGLIQALQQIASQIEEAQSVPSGLLPLVDPNLPPQLTANPAPGALLRVDDDVIAPLPLNDKQRQILRRVETNAQTVVQGPPGTGKTHMAAALISHLVAQGKRVLVTAHTDRALYEVRGKLPREVRPLAVSVMSGTQNDIADLQTAVREIARRSEAHDVETNRLAVERILAVVEQLRGERQVLNRRLVESRESEVSEVEFEGRSASLASFAQEFVNEGDLHGWADDLIDARSDLPTPLTDYESREWLSLLRDTGLAEAEQQVLRRRLDPSVLLTPPEFAAAVRVEQGAQANLDDAGESPMTCPDSVTVEAAIGLRDSLVQAVSEIDAALHLGDGWISEALRDTLAGTPEVWLGRARKITSGLESIERLSHAVPFGTRIDSGEGADQYVPMAQSLITHIQASGTIKVGANGYPRTGMFTPRVVKECQPFFERVRINGVPATTVESIGIFVRHTEAWRHLDELDKLWPASAIIPEEDTVQERVDWHRSQLQRVATIADLGVSLDAVKQQFASHGMPIADWSDRPFLVNTQRALEELILKDTLAKSQGPLSRLDVLLSELVAHGDAAEAVGRAQRAVRDRDVFSYAEAVGSLSALMEAAARLTRRDALSMRIREVAPRLCAAVTADPHSPEWEERASRVEGLFSRTRLGAWILSWQLDDANSLQAQLAVIEDRLTSLAGRVAALRAWGHAVSPERLTPGARADLASYADLVKKLGKGTGKYAAQRKAEIRSAMERCRPSVPVWIMPIYRVTEQFAMQENMFDVVIVDEASQAGLEATFLQYLAPSIVVIGDDRQVSPSSVGLDEQQLRDLATQYLAGDKYKANWQDPKRSLFDEAGMRYQGRLTLVEHRRCYREIIEFSNRIAYQPNGVELIPVRQFGADRLDPFVNLFVPTGNTAEGRSVNVPEAEALIADLLKCLDDPAFDDKTMAIISLVGAEQAKFIEGKLLSQVSSEEWARRHLRVGIAPDFQGAERDVIFLSMVSATEPGRRVAALTGEAYIQRFNVAVSRARDQVRLFHSIEASEIPREEDVRRRLLDHAYDVASAGRALSLLASELVDEDRQEAPFDSLFEQRVYNRLVERGYRVLPQQQEQGYRLDLVVVGARGRLAIECDGDHWHGPEDYSRDLARQRELERCGWHFFRVRESQFYVNANEALAPLWEELEKRGIHPFGRSAAEALSDTPVGEQAQVEAVEETPIDFDPSAMLSGGSDADISDAEIPWVPRRAALVEEEDGEAPRPNIPVLDEPSITYSVGSPANHLSPDEWDAHEDVADATDSRHFEMHPYAAFEGTTVPVAEAHLNDLVEGIAAIVSTEGPVTVARVKRAYVLASGGQRVGREIARLLDRALRSAIRRGRIKADPAGDGVWAEKTLCLNDGVPNRLRDLGPRDLDQVPRSELDLLVRELSRILPDAASDELTRAALRRYGINRLTDNARRVFAPSLGRGSGSDHNPITPGGVIRGVSPRRINSEAQGLARISGTTTFRRESANSIGSGIAGSPPGYAIVDGWLQNEELGSPGTRTVSLLIEGEAIGSLPGGLVDLLDLDDGERIPVLVQIFTSDTAKGLRVDAWAWIGDDKPQWDYSATARPPVTTADRAAENQAVVRQMVSEALLEGEDRAEEFWAGMVDGQHFLELVEPINQLKRENRLEEALALAYQAIEGAERSAKMRQEDGVTAEPPSWYTIQAAIICRKLKRNDQEVEVLERWLRSASKSRREGGEVAERLAKLQK